MAGHTSPKSAAAKPSSTGEQRAGSKEGADRRAHKRYEINLGGALSRDGIQFTPCRIHDFCLGGMAVVPSKFSGEDVLVGGKPVVRGDRLIVRCVANVGDVHLDHTVRGRALRVSSRGIGISFERTDPDEVWRVTQLVRELTEVLRKRRDQERSARTPCSPVATEQTVNARQLLKAMGRRIQRFLVSGMEATFQEADHWLFAQANEDSIESDRRTAFYAAMKELKRLKVPIESGFLDAIDRALKGLGRPTPQSASHPNDESKAELSLMDTGSFDDWLTAKDIISAAEPFLKVSQLRVEQKLSRLVNAAIDGENNPIGLTPLCLGFHDSIQDLGASDISRRAILQGFGKTAVQNLESLYDDLNTICVEGGLLGEAKPRIKEE